MAALLLLANLSEEAQPSPLPWWFWVVLFVVLVIILWWMWLQGRQAAPTTADETHPVTKAVEVGLEAPAPDDLVIIEGIGPKINSVLQAAGIHTFADLAAAQSAALKQILLDAHLRLADPTTWPQQAALARDGKLEELKKLQESLTAGRKS